MDSVEGNIVFVKKITKELVRDFSEHSASELLMVSSDIMFKDTLTFKGIVNQRAIIGRRPYAEWSNTALTFPMFLSDLSACMPYMIGGKLEGLFRVRISGRTQGIVYVPQHTHGNWHTEVSKGTV